MKLTTSRPQQSTAPAYGQRANARCLWPQSKPPTDLTNLAGLPGAHTNCHTKQLGSVHIRLVMKLGNAFDCGQPWMPGGHRGRGAAASKTLLSWPVCHACSSCSKAFILPQFMLLETCSQLFSRVSPAPQSHLLLPRATLCALYAVVLLKKAETASISGDTPPSMWSSAIPLQGRNNTKEFIWPFSWHLLKTHGGQAYKVGELGHKWPPCVPQSPAAGGATHLQAPPGPPQTPDAPAPWRAAASGHLCPLPWRPGPLHQHRPFAAY